MLYQETKARKNIRVRLCYVFITAEAEFDKMLTKRNKSCSGTAFKACYVKKHVNIIIFLDMDIGNCSFKVKNLFLISKCSTHTHYYFELFCHILNNQLKKQKKFLSQPQNLVSREQQRQ